MWADVVFVSPFPFRPTLFAFSGFALSEGEEGDSRAEKAHMEVQVKTTTPDLTWTELLSLQNTHSHSILMHPCLPQWMGSHYCSSTEYDSPSCMERLWKIAPWEELWGAQKGNVWGDDNAWKGINLRILLVICLLQRYVTGTCMLRIKWIIPKHRHKHRIQARGKIG